MRCSRGLAVRSRLTLAVSYYLPGHVPALAATMKRSISPKSQRGGNVIAVLRRLRDTAADRATSFRESQAHPGRVGASLAESQIAYTSPACCRNTPENMVRWIENPQAVDEKTVMPNLGVTEQDAGDIAGYLYTLK